MHDAKLVQLQTVVQNLSLSGCDVRGAVREVFFGYLYSIETIQDGTTPKNWQDVLYVWEEVLRFAEIIEPVNHK